MSLLVSYYTGTPHSLAREGSSSWRSRVGVARTNHATVWSSASKLWSLELWIRPPKTHPGLRAHQYEAPRDRTPHVPPSWI